MEAPSNSPTDILNCNDYKIELENCISKRRTGIYIKTSMPYTRRLDLDGSSCHIVIVDLEIVTKIRIINVYRSFNPPGGLNVTDFFNNQLDLIQKALCKNCYVMGDFNLEGGSDLRPDYNNKFLLNTLKLFASNHNLIQVVDFNTWSRVIKGIKKSPC